MPEIDRPALAVYGDLHRRDRVARDPHFLRPDVRRAAGDRAERDGRAGDAVDHLVESAISARRDDHIDTARGRLAGEFGGVTAAFGDRRVYLPAGRSGDVEHLFERAVVEARARRRVVR